MKICQNVVIGSGNFPLDRQVNPDAKRVYLNLMPGVPTSDQVLKALVSILNIEAGKMILPPEVKEKPSVFEAMSAFARSGIENL